MSDPKIYATPGVTKAESDDLPSLIAIEGDWNEISDEAARMTEERIVVNLGPVHLSIYGVYRLFLELDGEYVRETRGATDFLHTGIEKNMEYRTWTQDVAYVTYIDCVASFFQEVSYCMVAEKLLGIEEQAPRRANIIRALLMELQRIASHLAAIGSSLNELGATTMMTIAFCMREDIPRIFERISGLRMNYEFVRPGGVLEDAPEGVTACIHELPPDVRKGMPEIETIVAQDPIFKVRLKDVDVLLPSTLMALGQAGPAIKATGLPWDLRKSQLYCGCEDYEFEVPVYDRSDTYNRAMVRLDECYQSLRIVYQALGKLDMTEGESVTVEDKKIAWPARLSISTDNQGTAPAYVCEIMTEPTESLIHHFRLVTEGFHIPAGQAYSIVEYVKGVLGCHLVSSGGMCPYRAHVSDLGFRNLQDLSMMVEGGMPADTIVCLAAINPAMGGADR